MVIRRVGSDHKDDHKRNAIRLEKGALSKAINSIQLMSRKSSTNNKNTHKSAAFNVAVEVLERKMERMSVDQTPIQEIKAFFLTE